MITHKSQNIGNNAIKSYRFTDIVSSKTKKKENTGEEETMLQRT